jgi:hypothetical protein
MNRRFQRLDRKLNLRFTSVVSRLTVVNRRLKSHDARFDAIDRRFDAIDARFGKSSRLFAEVFRQLDSLGAKLDSKTRRIDSTVYDIDTPLTTFQRAVDAHEKRLNEIRSPRRCKPRYSRRRLATSNAGTASAQSGFLIGAWSFSAILDALSREVSPPTAEVAERQTR